MTLRPYKADDGEPMTGYTVITAEEMDRRRLEVLKPEKTREAPILTKPPLWRRILHSLRKLLRRLRPNA